MDYSKLSEALRMRADGIDAETRLDKEPDTRTAELLRVLARLVEGKTVYRAFGAPGDWGYGTPIGAALAEAYKRGLAESPIHSDATRIAWLQSAFLGADTKAGDLIGLPGKWCDLRAAVDRAIEEGR